MQHHDLTIILGPPGTGKTTRLTTMVRRAVEMGSPYSKIAFLAFNKHSALEGKRRVAQDLSVNEEDLTGFRTIHSTCLRLSRIGARQVLRRAHKLELGKRLGLTFSNRVPEDAEYTEMAIGDKIERLEELARNRREPLETVWKELSEDLDWWELERWQRAFNQFKTTRGLYDFTDFLTSFISDGFVPELDWLFIDEAQDLTRLQWEAVNKLATRARKVVAAGDDDQCSVEGTLVETNTGPVPVEKLDPDVHRIVCYDQNSSEIRGRKDGYGFEIESRDHDGSVVEVSSETKQTTTTLDHIWMVRWTKEAKEWNPTVVYMMQRGDWFRIGWCALFNVDGIFHLGIRSNKEKADHTWILRVCEDRTEASVWESILAATYGISTATFEPCSGAAHYTREPLTQIFNSIPDQRERAVCCLEENGLHIDYPLRTSDKVNRFGSSIFKARGYNLLSGMMEVPVDVGTRRPVWETITTRVYETSTKVYALNVDKYHNYIADGIITHNCINKWAGADVATFIGLKGQVIELNQSYRVPMAVWKAANKVVSRIKNRRPKLYSPRDAEGGYSQCAEVDEVDLSKGTWLLLARHGYQLEQYRDHCLQNGWSWDERAAAKKSPKEWDSLNAIQTWMRLQRGQKVNKAEAQMLAKFTATGVTPKLRKLDDAYQLTLDDLNFLYDYSLDRKKEWYEVLGKIKEREKDFFIRARKNGESLLKKTRILISTIHSAKGLEADHVLLMTDVTRKVVEGFDSDPDDEHRVFYVALTRSRQSLHVVQPQTVNHYEI